MACMEMERKPRQAYRLQTTTSNVVTRTFSTREDQHSLSFEESQPSPVRLQERGQVVRTELLRMHVLQVLQWLQDEVILKEEKRKLELEVKKRLEQGICEDWKEDFAKFQIDSRISRNVEELCELHKIWIRHLSQLDFELLEKIFCREEFIPVRRRLEHNLRRHDLGDSIQLFESFFRWKNQPRRLNLGNPRLGIPISHFRDCSNEARSVFLRLPPIPRAPHFPVLNPPAVKAPKIPNAEETNANEKSLEEPEEIKEPVKSKEVESDTGANVKNGAVVCTKVEYLQGSKTSCNENSILDIPNGGEEFADEENLNRSKKASQVAWFQSVPDVPVFLIIICIIQVVLYYAPGNEVVFWHLIFHPYRREEVWRYFTSSLLLCKVNGTDSKLWISLVIQFALATIVEKKLGSVLTGVIYTGSAAIGTLVGSMLIPGGFQTGNTNAIVGLWMSLISYSIMTMNKTNRIQTWLQIIICILMYVVYEIGTLHIYNESFDIRKIDFGGAVAGILIGFTVFHEPKPRKYWRGILKISSCIVLILSLCLAVVISFFYRNAGILQTSKDPSWSEFINDPVSVYRMCNT